MSKIKKLFITIITSLLLIGIIPINTLLAYKEVDPNDAVAKVNIEGDKFFDSIEDAFDCANDNKGSTITLLKDVKISSHLSCDNDFTLDLNGKTIDGQGKTRLINVNAGLLRRHALTVIDSSIEKTGKLINGKVTQNFGGAFLVGGILNFQGGTIENCTSNNDGGAVSICTGVGELLPSGIFNMSGGTIKNCTADMGGAVYIEDGGEMNMSGGTITNCHAKSKGGAIAIMGKKGMVNMSGGLIDSCRADTWAGGVNVYGDSEFHMSGGTIQNCVAPEGGGIVVEEGYTIVEHETPYQLKGGFADLRGGTIQSNHAETKGGGVYVHGFDATVFTAQIRARLTLADDINIINNTGSKREDGTNVNNLYLETCKLMDRDTPYFIVEGNLTGKIGISASQIRKMSYSSEYGNQTNHFFSDYRCWQVLFKNDNCYYLDWGDPDVINARLVTAGKDNSKSTVEIDRSKNRITIHANRELDLDSAFGYETVSIDWIGTDLEDKSGDQRYIYKESPAEITIFHYGTSENYYYEAFSVSLSQALKTHNWEIYIYGLNSSKPQELMAINADVFLEVGQDEYEKQEAKNVTKNKQGELVYHYLFYPGQRIKLEAYKPKEGEVFEYWDERVHVVEDPESSITYLTMPECTVGERAMYEDKSAYEYLLTVINGTGTKHETSERVSYVTSGTKIDIQVAIPSGTVLTMWTSQGDFTLTDEQKYSNNFLFTMPECNATLIANYETECKHSYTAYRVVDGQIDGKITSKSNITQYKPVEIEADTTIVGKSFIGWSTSDSSLKIKQDGNKVSFKMPRNDVELFANYYTDYSSHMLKLINTNKDNESGPYIHNAKIKNIKAEVPDDQIFDKWEFYKYDELITDDEEIKKFVDDYSSKALGIVTMPAFDLTIKATFKNKYKLTQIATKTPGETKHVDGDLVFIRPETRLGYKFDKWKINDSYDIPDYVVKLADEENTIRVVMPNKDVTIEAEFIAEAQPCKLTKVNTSKDGIEYYFPGINNIVINAIDSKTFESWKFFNSNDEEISYDNFKEYIDIDDGNGHLKITMPDFDVKIVGEYGSSLDKYLLTKINTENEGTTELTVGENDSVHIIEGKQLREWIFYKDGIKVSESELESCISYGDPQDKSHFTFTMPEANITIKARYEDELIPVTSHTLEQVGTIHEGKTTYKYGQENIPINSKSIFEKAFNGWEIYKVEGQTETQLTGEALNEFKVKCVSGLYYDSGSFNLKMPDYDLKIVATYKDEPRLHPHDLIQVKTIDEGTRRLYKNTEVYIEALGMVGVDFTNFEFYKENEKLVEDKLTEFVSNYVQGDITAGKFTLRMPDYDLKIVACFKQSPTYTYPLKQVYTIDSGERYYYQNSKVYIQASNVLGGEFDYWGFYDYEGNVVEPKDLDIVGDLNKDHFYIYTPNYGLIVVANYKESSGTTYKLEQVQTTTSGVKDLFASTKVSLKANKVVGGVFDLWKFYYRDSGQEIENPKSSIVIEGDLHDEEISIYMPEFNLKVEATYKEDDTRRRVELTEVLTKNEGNKFYASGTKVLIEALSLVGGEFDNFEFYKYDDERQEVKIVGNERKEFIKNHVSNYIQEDKVNKIFILTMPSYDLKVEATYKGISAPHKLIQEKTLDEGISYHFENESNIDIEALQFLDGEFKEFFYYEVTSSGNTKIDESKLKVTKIENNHIKLVMPDFDLKVVAEYGEYSLYRLTQINTSEILPKYSAVTLVNDGDIVTASYSGSLGGTFEGWSIIDTDTKEDLSSSIEITSGSINTSPISFIMPKRNVTIEAIYKGVSKPMKLAIVKGYLLDGNNIIEPVDIKDDTYIYYVNSGTSLNASFNSKYESLGGLVFDKWQVNKSSLTFDEPTNDIQIFTMPIEDTEIECLFVDTHGVLPTLNVINGGVRIDKELIPYDEYRDSTLLNVEAYVELGAEFDHWLFYRFEEVPSNSLELSSSKKMIRRELTSSEISSLKISKDDPKLEFYMPGYDLEFVALYKVNQVKLKVIDGYIDDPVDGHIEEKTYVEGYKPTICANVPNGYSFSHWEIIEGNPTLPEGGIYRGRTSLVVREDTTIKAHFTRKYSPPPTGVK